MTVWLAITRGDVADYVETLALVYLVLIFVRIIMSSIVATFVLIIVSSLVANAIRG